MGKKYIEENECKQSCDGSGYYQIQVTITSNTDTGAFECYEGPLNALASSDPLFCDTKRNKCFKIFPTTGYFIQPNDLGTNIKEIVESCDKFYDGNNCLNSCMNSGTNPILLMEIKNV